MVFLLIPPYYVILNPPSTQGDNDASKKWCQWCQYLNEIYLTGINHLNLLIDFSINAAFYLLNAVNPEPVDLSFTVIFCHLSEGGGRPPRVVILVTGVVSNKPRDKFKHRTH